MRAFKRCKPPLKKSFLILMFGFFFGLSVVIMYNKLNLLLDLNVKRLGCYDYDALPIVTPEAHNVTDLLLAGVMTAAKFVDTRAYNVWKSWAQSTPGRVFFFVSENTTSYNANEMPLIYLPGVNDFYPPQKKCFAMMRWMYDNYLEKFQWFMRSDDDLYVQNAKLEAFLRSLDSNKPLMIGQAGLGNSEQLFLGSTSNYCMGGTGVILSREALRLVGPHLESCLAELVTIHEDVEFGRCVEKYAGIVCTWSYEMRTFFHNNQTTGNSTKELVNSDFNKIITFHPVKNPDLMIKVHIHSEKTRLNALRQRKIKLLSESWLKIPKKLLSSVDIPSSTIPLIRRMNYMARDLQYWNYISMNKIFFCADHYLCPRHAISSSTQNAINKIIVQLFDKFNANARQRSRILQFKNLQYGYTRVEPRHGVDYILDIVLWYYKLRLPHRTKFSVRRHAYVQQTFGPIEALTDAEYRSRFFANSNSSALFNHKRVMRQVVYIIMSLQGRAKVFQKFMENLRQTLPSHEKSVKLLIVLYKCKNMTENLIISKTIIEFSQVFSLQVINVELVQNFSRGQALMKGVSVVPVNSLLFFTDVDMLFNYETIQRIRLNTISGIQAYFPIVFSEYAKKYWLSKSSPFSNDTLNSSNRSKDKLFQGSTFDADRGYFRSFGFGMFSIFKEDFHRVGGFNQSIQGWGSEDVDFFERCLRSHLRILRVPDPSLIHVFHHKQCNQSEMSHLNYKMCVDTMVANLASYEFLTHQMLQTSF